MAKEKGADFIVPSGRQPVSYATDEFIKKLGHVPQYHGALYLKLFTNPEFLAQRIDLAAKALKRHKFDAIAFMGISGTLIGPPVAMKLGKPFLLVRKPGHDSHSQWDVEGDYAAKSYIILDEFSETGQTKDLIQQQIKEVMPSAKYEGFIGVKYLTEATVEKYAKKKKPYPLER